MENRVTHREIIPGVFQLTDRMGMHIVLLVGAERALLVDTGYGLDDLNAAVRAITDKPFQVICTHGHHDHACGNFQFGEVFLCPEDFGICGRYAGGGRERVWGQALERGVYLADWTKEAFLGAGCGPMTAIGRCAIPLGGLTAEIYPLPGHTPGSLEILVPERKLLLPGDNWNETTWLFFEEACPLSVYRDSLRRTLEMDFDVILPPHNDRLFAKSDLAAFYEGTAPERLLPKAVPAPGMCPGVNVLRAEPAGRFTFCFDADKAQNR